jgi:hypothetical protein
VLRRVFDRGRCPSTLTEKLIVGFRLENTIVSFPLFNVA